MAAGCQSTTVASSRGTIKCIIFLGEVAGAVFNAVSTKFDDGFEAGKKSCVIHEALPATGAATVRRGVTHFMEKV
jgi:hypothetical protein